MYFRIWFDVFGFEMGHINSINVLKLVNVNIYISYELSLGKNQITFIDVVLYFVHYHVYILRELGTSLNYTD